MRILFELKKGRSGKQEQDVYIWLSLSRTLSISNKFSDPLRVRDRESELYIYFWVSTILITSSICNLCSNYQNLTDILLMKSMSLWRFASPKVDSKFFLMWKIEKRRKIGSLAILEINFPLKLCQSILFPDTILQGLGLLQI